MRNQPRFCLTFLGVIALASCGSATASSSFSTAASSGNYYAMDTVIQIWVGGNNAGVTSDDLAAYYSLYDALADNTIRHEGYTNVYDINQTNQPVQVQKELFDLLKFAYSMKTITQGYFNPLIGRLSDLWKKDLFNLDQSGTSLTNSGETYVPTIPTDAEIQTELDKMNASSLTFDEAALTVMRVGEGKIDLGGVAKGYAGQVIYSFAQSKGLTNYLVNAGSSTLIFGESGSGDGSYRLTFTDLANEYASVKNCTVGTSAIKEQNATVDGKLYSHIINPISGSALVDWYGAVILGQDAGVQDVLSTSFVLMGPGDLSDQLMAQYGLTALFYKDGVSTIVNKGITLYAS